MEQWSSAVARATDYDRKAAPRIVSSRNCPLSKYVTAGGAYCGFPSERWVCRGSTEYPKGVRSADYLAFYAERFHTVEVGSTFYACPSARTVSNWAARTPEDFVFFGQGSSPMEKSWSKTIRPSLQL